MRRTCILCAALLAIASLSAQEPSRGKATPISPEINISDRMGVLVGVPILVQQGQYQDTCNCPPFSGGSGSGITAGVLYEFPSEESQVFRFGVAAGLDYSSMLLQYREQELLTFTSSDGTQQYSNVPVEFRQQMRFRLFGLWGQPYLRIVPVARDVLALSIGLQAGTLLAGTAEHTKSLVQNTVRLPNGEVLALQMAGGSTSTVVRDGDIVGLERFQAAAVVRVESSIELSKHWRLRPGVQYAIPLIPLSSSGNTRVAAWLFMFSLVRETER
ncbi:MAG: hypothetical protein KatS3mg039_1239 [Candidatus Kapaibacterium sp.]|nr:MAG: hypothetical protein KatS3mg039_1239 [Candidatus Kapabacteria bacterium]